jgi:hypothetical protein
MSGNGDVLVTVRGRGRVREGMRFWEEFWGRAVCGV